MNREDYISYNQIRASKCMHYYKNIYLKNKNIQNDAMKNGSQIHEILDKYFKRCKEKKCNDIDFMQQLLSKYNCEISTRYNLLRIAKSELNIDNIYETEKELNINICKDSKGKDIILKVRIDRIDMFQDNNSSTIQILDYKNQYFFPDKKTANEDLQLKIYEYAASKEFDYFDYIRSGFYLVRYNCPRMNDYKEIKNIEDELKVTEDFIVASWEKMKNSNSIEPTPCCLCDNCAADCINNNSKKIIEKVRLYRKNKIKLKKEEDEIKQYYKENDIDIIDDTKVGYELTNNRNKFFI